MARYTGPKNRIARRFGVNIFGRARNPLIHKQNPPGQHGARHKKKSDYGVQLEGKQKLRAVYGMIAHKQLVNIYKKATLKQGNTSQNFIAALESRLDNVVYRLKLAPTIFAAQQLVSHGHVLVDGKKVDIRSYEVAPGQTVAIKEASRNMEILKRAQAQARDVPGYLTASDAFSGQLLSKPTLEQIPMPIEINLHEICDFLAHTT